MATTNSVTRGVHHVGLTVPDLNAAQAFFVDALGFNVLGKVPDYPAVFLSDGGTMITLWQADKPGNATGFDRKNVIGLHHLAFKVDGDALDPLYTQLQTTVNVKIEFAPEPLGDGPTRHFTISMPGGIRIEFIAPAA
ncbi:MAG TPA: VOC family protein [Porticoccus sp.]|nr:VOC family protein [Porticoccus sp.]